MHITLSDEARQWLTAKGYDKLYGARPMGRLMQTKIKQPLAEELLFGKLVHGGEVVVDLKGRCAHFRGHARRAAHRQAQEGWCGEKRRPASGQKPRAPKTAS